MVTGRRSKESESPAADRSSVLSPGCGAQQFPALDDLWTQSGECHVDLPSQAQRFLPTTGIDTALKCFLAVRHLRILWLQEISGSCFWKGSYESGSSTDDTISRNVKEKQGFEAKISPCIRGNLLKTSLQFNSLHQESWISRIVRKLHLSTLLHCSGWAEFCPLVTVAAFSSPDCGATSFSKPALWGFQDVVLPSPWLSPSWHS